MKKLAMMALNKMPKMMITSTLCFAFDRIVIHNQASKDSTAFELDYDDSVPKTNLWTKEVLTFFLPWIARRLAFAKARRPWLLMLITSPSI